MDRRHRSGQVALGIGLALLVGLAEVGLHRSATPPAAPVADAGRMAAPSTLSGFGALQAPDPPGAVNLPAPTCRVVGHLAKATAGEEVIWGTITNVGALTTTVDGVELGWAGDATLSEILARRGPGESTKTLFAGKAASPFFATHDAGWTLAAGESAQIGLRFDWVNPDAPWLLQAAVVHLRDGCRAVLRPAADGPPCPVRITDRPHVPASARNRVEVTVENTGQKEDFLTALEVAWPVATNGRLRKVTVDGATVIDLREGFGASPATLPLARMREDGIVIEPGKPRAIGLEFERTAAKDGYSLQGTTRLGCSLSTTTGLAASDCGVVAGDVAIDGDIARYKLSNPRDIDRAVSELTLFWPTAANGPLVAVTVDGQTVWRDQQGESRSPLALTLPEPIRLPAGGSVELAFRFRPPSAAGAGPQLAAGAYTLVTTLDGGCQSAFTNRAAVGQCDLSAGELISVVEPASHNMRVDVFNNGDEVRLHALHLTWPKANGDIRGIRWSDRELLPGAGLAYATEGVTFTLPADGVMPLAQGGRASLSIDFAQAPLPDGYALTLRFDNRRGDPCRTLLVTRQTPPSRGADAPCGAALIGPRFGATRAQFLFQLVNNGDVSDALVGLDIKVAQFDPLSPLSTVEVERSGGETESLWVNDPLRRPPYLVRLGEPLKLGPGEAVTLRLQFLPTFLPTGSAEDVVTMRADFGGGCETWNVPPGAEPPASTLLSGVIAALPDPLQSCCWLVRRWDNDIANREFKVDVDANTVLEPASVTPRDGDPVSVTAIARADGSLYAQRIVFQRRGAQVKVAGPIDKLGPISATRPGLPEWFVIQGRLVSLTDGTTVNGELTLGAAVFVTGSPNGGAITAGTIEVANAAVKGLLSRKSVEGILVRTEGQGADLYWTVANSVVHITSATQYFDANGQPIASPALPAPGTPLRAEGAVESRGPDGGTAVRADSVWFLPHRPDMRVAGTILQMPPAGEVGEWKVADDAKGTVTFVVRSMAVVDTRVAPAQAGNRVAVILQQAEDGTWVALRLRTDWGKR